MNSRTLILRMQKYDGVKFSKWFPVHYSSAGVEALYPILDPVYEVKGLYVFKSKPQFSRLEGKSDILYIGQGRIGNRIYAALGKVLQIKKFKTRNYKHNAKKWIHKLLEDSEFEIYVNYCRCSKRRAEALEKSYLREYKEEHYELPPFNGQIG